MEVYNLSTVERSSCSFLPTIPVDFSWRVVVKGQRPGIRWFGHLLAVCPLLWSGYLNMGP